MEYRNQLIPLGHPNRPGGLREGLSIIGVHYTNNDKFNADDIMNADYFARKWHRNYNGVVSEYIIVKEIVDGNIIYTKKEIPFQYGSTHKIVDEDSCTNTIPTTEPCWGLGDRPLPFDLEWKGQKKVAKRLCNWRQNYRSMNVEICNNRSWDKAVNNAKIVIIEYIKSLKYKYDLNEEFCLYPETIEVFPSNALLILRHFDVTGKICPKPMVDNPKSWESFVKDIIHEIKG
jgi:N-acetylmuramoyl-L-alanine amidase CwlA